MKEELREKREKCQEESHFDFIFIFVHTLLFCHIKLCLFSCSVKYHTLTQLDIFLFYCVVNVGEPTWAEQAFP